MGRWRWLLCAIAALGGMSAAHAWKLSPEGSFIEKKLANKTQNYYERIAATLALRGIEIIGDSVHEEITNRTLGCEGDKDVCGAPEFDPDFAYYLAGIRWNDDPPFRFSSNSGNFSGCTAGQTVRLVTQPQCWANTFKDGEARAGKGANLDGSNATILARSHFGDLQFLHAMASADQEAATTTQAKILAWSEFTWRLGLGEYDLETQVAGVPVAGFDTLFAKNRDWRVQDLFALGNPHIRTPEAMSKVAFGSLLHMVQDSFAGGHAERRPTLSGRQCDKAPAFAQPGKIVEFHSYSNQHSGKHGGADSRNAFSAHWSSGRPTVVDIGRELAGLHKRKAPWSEVQPYIECIFALDSAAASASAGDAYRK